MACKYFRINPLTGLLILIFISFNLNFSLPAYGHSGGTDSYGGHNCRVYPCAGTYHTHNGGYDTFDHTEDYIIQGTDNGTSHAEDDRRSILNIASFVAQKEGKEDGLSDSIRSSSPDFESTCSKDFEFESPQPTEYVEAYNKAYYLACSDIYATSYSDLYDSAYNRGLASYNASTQSEPERTVAIGSVATGNNFIGSAGWYWMFSAAGIVLFISLLSYLRKDHK